MLTAIWEPEKVSFSRGWHSEYIWFSPKIREMTFKLPRPAGAAEGHGSPVTDKDYREAEERWSRKIAIMFLFSLDSSDIH